MRLLDLGVSALVESKTASLFYAKSQQRIYRRIERLFIRLRYAVTFHFLLL